MKKVEWKIIIIVLTLILGFSFCKRNERKKTNEDKIIKLKIENKRFDKIEFKKFLSIKFLSRWCLPVEDKNVIVCEEMGSSPKEFRLAIFDEEGKPLLKTALIPYGKGPTDVYAWNADSIYIYKGKIVFLMSRI